MTSRARSRRRSSCSGTRRERRDEGFVDLADPCTVPVRAGSASCHAARLLPRRRRDGSHLRYSGARALWSVERATESTPSLPRRRRTSLVHPHLRALREHARLSGSGLDDPLRRVAPSPARSDWGDSQSKTRISADGRERPRCRAHAGRPVDRVSVTNFSSRKICAHSNDLGNRLAAGREAHDGSTCNGSDEVLALLNRTFAVQVDPARAREAHTLVGSLRLAHGLSMPKWVMSQPVCLPGPPGLRGAQQRLSRARGLHSVETPGVRTTRGPPNQLEHRPAMTPRRVSRHASPDGMAVHGRRRV